MIGPFSAHRSVDSLLKEKGSVLEPCTKKLTYWSKLAFKDTS